MRGVVGAGRRAVDGCGVDVWESGRPGQIDPRERAVVVPVPSGAVSAAASVGVGGKRAVDQLAVGVEVAPCTEGTVAAVGRERRRWRRSAGCIRDFVDGVGVGDVEAVGKYAIEQCSLRERLCSA